MNRILKLSIISILTLAFSSCSFIETGNKPVENKIQSTVNKQQKQQTKLAKYPTIEETINKLTSEELQGRAVGTEGNDLAAEYIKNAFEFLGLEPIFEGSYYQTYYQGVRSNLQQDNSQKELKALKNVIGVIKGKDPKKAVIISAHFDHVGYKNGTLIRGAFDNASGVSALLEMASILKGKSKEHTFDMNIVFCAFNGEETLYKGSGAFVKAIFPDIYENLYNINIDCIGAKKGGKLALKSKEKSCDKLYSAVKSVFKKNNVEYSEAEAKGGSDHKVFETIGFPYIYIAQENNTELIHKPTDTPGILDNEKIRETSKALSDFIISSDGKTFE